MFKLYNFSKLKTFLNAKMMERNCKVFVVIGWPAFGQSHPIPSSLYEIIYNKKHIHIYIYIYIKGKGKGKGKGKCKGQM